MMILSTGLLVLIILILELPISKVLLFDEFDMMNRLSTGQLTQTCYDKIEFKLLDPLFSS
jgi:hypothetical protein